MLMNLTHLDQSSINFLPRAFIGNDNGPQGWVVLERNDSKDTGSTVNNVDVEVLDGSSYVTEHELLTSSD